MLHYNWVILHAELYMVDHQEFFSCVVTHYKFLSLSVTNFVIVDQNLLIL